LYSLPYDVIKDFAPISPLVTTPLVLFARKTLPAKDLNELIAWLKDNPNKVSAGIVAVAGRLVAAYFQKETGTHFVLVPYRGVAPATQDLVAGQIDLLIGTPDELPLTRAGSIKAYAVTSNTRIELAPDIPTFAEMGLPVLSYSGWYGLFAPTGTPRDIIGKINTAAVEALADPAVQFTARRSRAGDFSTRATDAGGARRLAKGRRREMVADHQGVGDQSRVTGQTACSLLVYRRCFSWRNINIH
jgi:tripartite-type tricarboxylate transporter receptor subunit TctC